VSWPQSIAAPSGIVYVAASGRRLVAFTLSVTQTTDDSGLLNAPTGVTAMLKVGAASAPVSVTKINQQIAGGTSGSANTTGTDSFVASVPASTHDVALALSEAGFTQSLDLWTLKRLPPSPSVLYRAPTSSTVTGTASGPFHLSFTNPADGFTSTDNAQVSSAILSYFAPGQSFQTPKTPDETYLILGLQSSYPNIPYGQPNSGHFFSGFNPMAGTELTFTPSGGSPVDGLSNSSVFSSANAASDDDGLFDAVYFFSVPATTTGGTLTVNTGQQVGDEYTGFTGTGNSTIVNLTASATATLSFPAVPSPLPAQKKLPWVGAPLPGTGLAAAPSAGSSSGSTPGRSPGHGFPIWAAVLALVVVAGVVVLVQRRHRRGALTSVPVAAPLEDSAERVEPPAPPIQSVFATPPRPARPQPAPVAALRINLLGPLDLGDLRTDDVRRIVVELLVYLACHDHRHLRVGQIALGLRPLGSGRPEVAEKTLRNYLSELRQWVGPEHLPESSAKEGYLLHATDTDMAEIVRLCRQADANGGAEAIPLRTEALALVRGRPFEGLLHDGFEWVEAEHLDSQMAGVIAGCVVALGTAHLEAEDFAAALEAAWAGRRGAPDDYGPWYVGAQAISGQGERSALNRWMTDASRHLDRGDIARIWDSLGPDHDPPPER
jgi:hypothetical protein